MDGWIQNLYTSLLECDLFSIVSRPHTFPFLLPRCQNSFPYLVVEEKIQQAAKVGFLSEMQVEVFHVFDFDSSFLFVTKKWGKLHVVHQKLFLTKNTWRLPNTCSPWRLEKKKTRTLFDQTYLLGSNIVIFWSMTSTSLEPRRYILGWSFYQYQITPKVYLTDKSSQSQGHPRPYQV